MNRRVNLIVTETDRADKYRLKREMDDERRRDKSIAALEKWEAFRKQRDKHIHEYYGIRKLME